MVLGEYKVIASGLSVFRAGVRSAFLLDDVHADVLNKDGTIARGGRHSGSLSQITGVLRAGEYVLRIRVPLTASTILLGEAAGDWEKLQDGNGNFYFYSKVLKKTRWDPPPSDAGTWCVRYALSVSLEPASEEEECGMGAGRLPASLNVPGLLGVKGSQVRGRAL